MDDKHDQSAENTFSISSDSIHDDNGNMIIIPTSVDKDVKENMNKFDLVLNNHCTKTEKVVDQNHENLKVRTVGQKCVVMISDVHNNYDEKK